MKIAFITSEAEPFAKTGGLGDVSRALPAALALRGHDVRIIMPRYYGIDKVRFGLRQIHSNLRVPMGFDERWAAIYESSLIPGVNTYFIEHENYFGRDGLYDNGYNAFGDNAERFIFFSRSVMEAMKALNFKPDIIHCNDWQAALVPVYRKTIYSNDPFFKDSATVMTIHNVGYQGVFHKDNIFWTQLGWDIFNVNGLEFYDQVNFLKGGILFADAVTTVSRKYADELQSPDFGYNLADVFRRISGRLYGIMNGIDLERWDPSKDDALPSRYSVNNLGGKQKCRLELQRRMNISSGPDTPLLGTITRITYQKGMDVLAETLERIIDKINFQFVILGSGEEWIIKWFEHLRSKYPDRIGLFWGYDDRLSHLIEAGIDIFLMPSRYEPCGLNQMYSLRYGSIPIVRATGGLDDTIEDWNDKSMSGNGFKFSELNSDVLGESIGRAISAWHDRDRWKLIMQNAMKFHRSWSAAVLEYEEIYGIAGRKE
jgi:starch synthase